MKFCNITTLLCAVVLLSASAFADDGPFWKIFCQQTPIYRGLVDPIVEPGKVGTAQHSHKVFGGSNFGASTPTTTPEDYYDHIRAASCTTSSVTIDNSNYWIGDLYYRWDNGSISLVPTGGLTVYYLSRRGSSPSQMNPNWQPFPRGFRMIAGSPTRRSYNASLNDNMAISYACISSQGAGPETGGFPTERFCDQGMRAQVFFPMCWNGVDLDSTNHKSHVAYPSGYNGGDCPPGFPVRTPGVFFEVLFSVTDFPHGNGQPNRFVWSNGDTTGYSLHGDFLNGWDVDIMNKALHDVSCYGNNTDSGNDVQACNAFAPYVKNFNQDASCQLAVPIPTTEDLGIGHLIQHLPGCNPLYGGPADAVTCHGSWSNKILTPGAKRVYVKSVSTGQYWFTNNQSSTALSTVTDTSTLWYGYVYSFVPQASGLYTIQNDQSVQYVTSPNTDPISADRGSPSLWETFNITWTTSGGVSYAVIQSQSNHWYLTPQADGTIRASSKIVNGTAQLWQLVDVDQGTVDKRTSISTFTGSLNLAGANWLNSTNQTGAPSPTSSPSHVKGSASHVTLSVVVLLLSCMMAVL